MRLHLIFDLDGTIIDSAGDFHTSILELLKRYNAPEISYEQARDYIGNGFRGFIQSFHPHPGPDTYKQVYQEFLSIYETQFLTKTKPYEGICEYIKNSPHEISLCTNKPEKYAYHSLEHYGLLNREWTGLVYGDSFPTPKPHPQGVEHLIHLSEIPREKTVFIGDGLPDILAAKNAGLTFIGVEFGYFPPKDLTSWGADHILDHYQNLEAYLKKIL